MTEGGLEQVSSHLQIIQFPQILLCLIEYCLPVLHFLPSPVHHPNPGIVGQLVGVPMVKMPIEAVEWTGSVSGLFGFVVATRAAVIPHFVDIVGGGDVWLGADDAPIRKLAHAPGVGNLDPFDRVDVDTQVPFVHSIGVDSC